MLFVRCGLVHGEGSPHPTPCEDLGPDITVCLELCPAVLLHGTKSQPPHQTVSILRGRLVGLGVGGREGRAERHLFLHPAQPGHRVAFLFLFD